AHEVPVMVFCGPDADAEKRVALEACGCEVISVRVIEGMLWLPAITEALAARSITRLLVEGGPAIWQSFARAGFVDEAVVFQARGRAGIVRRPPAAYLPGVDLMLTAQREFGPDDMMIFRRPNRPA